MFLSDAEIYKTYCLCSTKSSCYMFAAIWLDAFSLLTKIHCLGVSFPVNYMSMRNRNAYMLHVVKNCWCFCYHGINMFFRSVSIQKQRQGNCQFPMFLYRTWLLANGLPCNLLRFTYSLTYLSIWLWFRPIRYRF